MIRVITEDGYIQYINPTFIIKVYNDGDNKTRIVLANNATLCTKKHSALELTTMIENKIYELSNTKEWFN